MISFPTRNLITIVDDLKRAAASAHASGDLLAAEAFERQAKGLEHDFALAGSVTNGLTFSAVRIDIDRFKTRWSALQPAATHSTEDVCVIDCGERGAVTFVGGAILFSGRIAMEPTAALLLAVHAMEHHRGGGTAFGSPEFLLHVAAANAAVGSSIEGPSVNVQGSEQVRLTAHSWQPLLTQLRSRIPNHPSPTIRRVEQTGQPVAT